jgi:hypothetical protein
LGLAESAGHNVDIAAHCVDVLVVKWQFVALNHPLDFEQINAAIFQANDYGVALGYFCGETVIFHDACG